MKATDLNGMTRDKALEMLADYPAIRRDYLCSDGKRLNGTVFILLPRELWRDADGCCCRYCSKDPKKSGEAYWDTLAIEYKDGFSHAWTVHAPELHGARPKRGI